MAAVLGPAFWCHQCNRQTRPVTGPDFSCTFCDGGFVEEMDNTEIEPGIPFSRLPLHLASILGLPFPVFNGLGTAGHQGYRPRLIHGHHPRVSDLLGAMTEFLHQFPDHPMNSAVSGDGYPPTVDIPSNRMLIMQGDLGSLANIEVFIGDGIGAQPQLIPGHFGDYFLGAELDRLIQILAENDPNRYGTPPASKAAIDAMPAIRISEKHMKNEVMQCAVCKDDFECGTEVRQMPCKHMYHGDCILPWLSQHSTCPVCRFRMPTDLEDGLGRLHVPSESSLLDSGGDIAYEPYEGNAAGRSYGGAGSGRVLNGNVQPQETRHFTLLGMPGIGMDSNGMFADEQNSSYTAPTTSQPESSDIGTTGIGLPNPIPWLFRLFSSFAPSTNPGDQAGRPSSATGIATMVDEQLQEGNSDVSRVQHEDLD